MKQWCMVRTEQLVINIAPEAAMMTAISAWLPLHVAAVVLNADAARLLLAAAPEAAMTADVHGRLPLHLSLISWNGRKVSDSAEAEIVQLLLAAAPQVAMAADENVKLPLHCTLDGHDSPNLAVLQLLLAAAPGSAMAADGHGWLPLHYAAVRSTDAVGQLLGVAAQAAMAADNNGMPPLHHEARCGDHEAIVRALLSTAAQAAMAADGCGRLPLHWTRSEAATQLLVAAAPATAMVRDAEGLLPIDALLEGRDVEAARAVLPATETHAALAAFVGAGEAAVPLFADVACQRPISSADWPLVPTPCAGLGAALPAVARVTCRGRPGREAAAACGAAAPAGLCPVPPPLPACISVCCHPGACSVISGMQGLERDKYCGIGLAARKRAAPVAGRGLAGLSSSGFGGRA